MARDPYELLGVSRDADEAQIKKAFRRVARELHPDVNTAPDAEQRFKEVAEAYEILSDADRRATFDRYGHEGLRSGGYAAPNMDGFGSLSDLLGAFFGQGSPFGGGGQPGGPVQGADVAGQVAIDLVDAWRGIEREIAFDVAEKCGTCHGNQAEPGTPIVTCSRCGGAGQLQGVTRTAFGQMVRTVVCDVCDGDGRIPEQPCHTCRGRGVVQAHRRVSVDVPAGISDGQRIRVTGRGHAGERGGPPGDLYVLVRVRDDARFVRDGRDLVTAVDVAAPLAALGTRMAVATVDGEPEEIEIAAGTQPGEVITLRGQGMPSLDRGRRPGDLRVVVNVVVPRRLNRRQRELLEELADSLGDDNLREDESVLSKLKRALAG